MTSKEKKQFLADNPFAAKLEWKLVKLLLDVKNFIKENPEQFDLDTWGYPSGNECGTIGCIAGHMAFRDTPKKEVKAAVLADIADFKEYNPSRTRIGPGTLVHYSDHTRRIVTKWRNQNIPSEFEGNFARLFYTEHFSSWDNFRTKSGKIIAHTAAKRIDYFLKTGE